MRRRDVIVGASAFALAGCVTVAPPSLPPGALQERRRIAVVTAFDPELVLTFLGLTVLDTSIEEVRVDWPLNAHSKALSERLLAPHFTLVDVAVDPAAIVETQRPRGFRNRQNGLEDLIRARVPAGSVDAIVVVTSTPVRQSVHPMIGTPPNDWPYGLRVWGLRSMRSGVRSTFLIAYKVAVIDGTTFATLASASPSQTTTLPIATLVSDNWVRETAPMEVLDFTWRGQDWAEMPLEQREALRLAAPRIIDRSLPVAFRMVGLLTEEAA